MKARSSMSLVLIKNLLSLPDAKGEDENDSKRQKTKNALVLFSIIGFQKECPAVGPRVYHWCPRSPPAGEKIKRINKNK